MLAGTTPQAERHLQFSGVAPQVAVLAGMTLQAKRHLQLLGVAPQDVALTQVTLQADCLQRYLWLLGVSPQDVALAQVTLQAGGSHAGGSCSLWPLPQVCWPAPLPLLDQLPPQAQLARGRLPAAGAVCDSPALARCLWGFVRAQTPAGPAMKTQMARLALTE